MQQALVGWDEKDHVVGNSTLVGGVGWGDQIIASCWRSILPPDIRLYHLAAPGSNATTSLLPLDVLQLEEVTGVERVIIEALPGKFCTHETVAPTPPPP